MPDIGKPRAGSNPFQKVKRYQGPNRANGNSNRPSEEATGDILNRITGRSERVGASSVKMVDGKKQGKIGKDGFLKLLTHQLKNQDPMKPMDQNKFAAHLAQFSQLEQMTNMNQNFEKSLNQAPAQNKFYAASFLGKKVITSGSTVKHKGIGTSSMISFKLENDMSKGIMRIFDQKNQMIQQIDLDAKPKGLHAVPWNGKQFDGTDAGKGVYRVAVLAYDNGNQPISVQTQAEGVVTSVNFEDGETVLTVDGKKVFLRDVQSFHLADDKEMGHNNIQRTQQAKSAYTKSQGQ